MQNPGLIFLIGASVVFTGCKKGEEDPFLSLRPRAARLSGMWDVVSATVTKGDTTWAFDDGNLTTSTSITEPVSVSMDWYYVFDKEGAYTEEKTTDFPIGFFKENMPAFTLVKTEKGQWQFTGGAGESKENSMLLLLPEEVSSTRTDQGSNIEISNTEGQNKGTVYEMLKLSNEELKLQYEVRFNSAFGNITEKALIELKKE